MVIGHCTNGVLKWLLFCEEYSGDTLKGADNSSPSAYFLILLHLDSGVQPWPVWFTFKGLADGIQSPPHQEGSPKTVVKCSIILFCFPKKKFV